MAVQLGPGGRGLLVLLGALVIAAGIVRAGWFSVESIWPSAPPPQPAAPRAWAWRGSDLPCGEQTRVAVPPRAAVLRLGLGAEARLLPVAHGAAALGMLARGEADAAIASVAELAAAWPPGAGARIERVLGAGNDLLVVAATELRADQWANRSIAAPGGSAEAFLASAAKGAALHEVDGARQALEALGAGRVDAAIVPRWQAGPAGPIGRPAILEMRMPIDPMLLVVAEGRAACVRERADGGGMVQALEKSFGRPLPLGDVGDDPPAAGDLVIAWAAARQGLPALPPLELAVGEKLAHAIWGGGAP